MVALNVFNYSVYLVYSSQGEQVASYLRLIRIYIFRGGTEIARGRLVLAAKIVWLD